MYIQLNSQVLYYEHCGEGKQSLILLHGNGETHEIFDRLMETLASDFDIYHNSINKFLCIYGYFFLCRKITAFC